MDGTIVRIPLDPQTQKRKGFGFVKGADGIERFFHASALDGSPKPFRDVEEGDRCTFAEAPGRDGKGPRATDMRVR